ncbi:cytochrome P450 [Atractiella rhizophila]|nr:cytochrome P450 [Atractiella rhizophila]
MASTVTMMFQWEKLGAVVCISLSLNYIYLSYPYYRAIIVLWPTLSHYLSVLTGHAFPNLPQLASFWLSYALYLCLVFTAVFLYRLSPLHPLAPFPGPKLAKLNMWWYLPQAVKGTERWDMKELHEKYGDFVRIGPNHLCIRSVDALKEVYSYRANVKRSNWYDALDDPKHPGVKSLMGMREKGPHSERRRMWEPLLGIEGLARFRPIMRAKLSELVHHLERLSEDGPICLSDWFSFFQVDVMGELTFSGGFTLMRDGEDKNGYLRDIGLLMRLVKALGHMQFLLPLFSLLPQSLIQPGLRWKAEELVKKRTNRNAESFKDLYYFLLDEENEGNKQRKNIDEYSLYNDAALAIIAGGETTAITLTYLFYALLQSGWLSKLQAEIDSAFPDKEIDDISLQNLRSLPLLTAVINESQRLNPTVSSGLPREIVDTPLLIDGRFIPVGTTVCVPFYAVARDERYFYHPDEFRPQRWLPSRPEKETFEAKASVPFSSGAYSCIGKSLAMEELRTVLVVLLKHFEFNLSDDFNEDKFLSSSRDFLAMTNPPLEVYVKKRH